MSVCLSVCLSVHMPVCVSVCRRNILDTQNSTYLKSCRYNSHSDVDSLCPIFTIGDIVNEVHGDNDSFDNIALLVYTYLYLSLHLSTPLHPSIHLRTVPHCVGAGGAEASGTTVFGGLQLVGVENFNSLD